MTSKESNVNSSPADLLREIGKREQQISNSYAETAPDVALQYHHTALALEAGAAAYEIVQQLARTQQPERYGQRIHAMVLAARRLIGDQG